MTITDWIIQLSIFGVLALAVVGTVQNLVDAMKKRAESEPGSGILRPVVPRCAGPQQGEHGERPAFGCSQRSLIDSPVERA